MKSLVSWWANIPAFLRDFCEGVAAAGVAGAVAGILAMNLDAATPKQAAYVALTGAISAVIAYARHRLVPRTP